MPPLSDSRSKGNIIYDYYNYVQDGEMIEVEIKIYTDGKFIDAKLRVFDIDPVDKGLPMVVMH